VDDGILGTEYVLYDCHQLVRCPWDRVILWCWEDHAPLESNEEVNVAVVLPGPFDRRRHANEELPKCGTAGRKHAPVYLVRHPWCVRWLGERRKGGTAHGEDVVGDKNEG
jgi:hypothetical protein